MNFLHLSFEDFFAYKLKFLSDIASPFNERLLARRKLRRSRWSTCTPGLGDAWIQSQKYEFYKILYGDLSPKLFRRWLIHSSNIIIPTRGREGDGKCGPGKSNVTTRRFYTLDHCSNNIDEQEETALVNFTFTIAILLRDLLHFLGKDIVSITERFEIRSYTDKRKVLIRKEKYLPSESTIRSRVVESPEQFPAEIITSRKFANRELLNLSI